jgi:RimJ/RimL family protein N-acetyltransferase
LEHPILPLPRETARLVLRPPSAQNAEVIQTAIEESFADLHPWMDWADRLQTLEETRAFLAGAETRFRLREDFGVSAFLRETGEYVLGSGLHPRNWRVPSFEIGYWCRTSMQGQGLVTEAVRALTQMAFEDMGARRVEIRCDARNTRSRHVAERAGFPLEATLRSDARANDGSLRDTVVYALLRSESDAHK